MRLGGLKLSLAARQTFFLPLPVAALRLAFTALVVGLFVCADGWGALQIAIGTGRDRGISLQRAPGPGGLLENSKAARRALAVRGSRSSKAKEQSTRAERVDNVAFAETLFKEGETLSAEWTEAALRKSIERFAVARSYWHAAGRVQDEVRALSATGEIFISLSEYQNALKTYNEELSISKQLSDRVHALNGISAVYIFLGEEKKALSYCQSAYRLSREANNVEGQAESLNNTGDVYYFQGESQKALETLEQALSLWPDQTWRGRAQTLINIGYCYFDLRNMDKALSFYQQALSQSRGNQNRRGEALALTAIGGVYSYLGNKQTALEYQNQAVKLFRTIGDRNGEAVALNGLGYVYRNLAEYQQSLDSYLGALKLFQILGNREYETFTITRVGKAYEGLGDNARALEYYRLALDRAVNYSQTKAHALNSIGSVFESMRQPRKALVYYERSLALFRATKDKMGEASVLNSLGKIYLSFGKTSEALESYRHALTISRAVRDRRGEVAVLLNIAQAQRDTGRYQEARQTIENSLSIIELLRTEVASPVLRASYFASVRKHYELYMDILMQMHKGSPADRFAEEAFDVSEKARARSLLELLEESHVNIRQGVDPTLLEQARAVRQQLNSKAERRMQLVSSGKIEEADALAKEIDQLTSENDQVEVQIRSKSPRYAALTQPQPLRLNEIQQSVLDDNSLLLEYMLGDDRSYVWAVTRREVWSFELPGRAHIEEAALRFHKLLTANQPVPGETFEQRQARVAEANMHIAEEAALFSKLVLGPVADKLGRKRLLIVPDGALQYIPFQALTVPQTTNSATKQASTADSADEQIPLFVDHEIVNEPSASTLALVMSDKAGRKPAPNSVVVFANPVFEADDPRVKPNSSSATPVARLSQETRVQEAFRDVGFGEGKQIPPLPASREEADAIMSVVPWRTGLRAEGFEASRATITGPGVSQYRIVHFATHGFVDYQHPELSGLVLSLVDEKGNPQDGFLRMHDIYNLKLPVDLVVLSACNTGLGKDIRGEGLMGLTRGFMYAGAGGVVASLWKVDDDATAELMKHFYEGMFMKGLSPAAALREAQLTMWRQKRWHAPYYWGAFVIQGQYDQKEMAGRRPTAFQIATLAAVISALFIAAFLFMRRRRTKILQVQ